MMEAQASYLVVVCVDVAHDAGNMGIFQFLLPLQQSAYLLEVTSETSTNLLVNCFLFGYFPYIIIYFDLEIYF